MGRPLGRTGPYHSAPAVEDKEPGCPNPDQDQGPEVGTQAPVVDGLSWVIYYTVAVASREVLYVPQGRVHAD